MSKAAEAVKRIKQEVERRARKAGYSTTEGLVVNGKKVKGMGDE